MGKRIATIGIILFLLYLFIVPASSLNEVCGNLRANTQACVTAVHAEDWDRAVSLLRQAGDSFLQYRDGMHLYLDHKDIAELETSLKGCLQMAQVQENGQLLMELEHILTQLDYIQGIETLTLFNLL